MYWDVYARLFCVFIYGKYPWKNIMSTYICMFLTSMLNKENVIFMSCDVYEWTCNGILCENHWDLLNVLAKLFQEVISI